MTSPENASDTGSHPDSRPVGGLFDGALAPIGAALSPWVRTGRRLGVLPSGERDVWVEADRAHIEAPTLADPEAAGLRAVLQDRLERMESVRWAEVSGFTRRVVVGYDPQRLPVGELVAVVEEAEQELHRTRAHPQEAEHPADDQPLREATLALAADLAGLGMTLLPRRGAPVEAIAVVSLLKNQPRVRALVERHLGQRATELGLSVSGALIQGLAASRLSLAVDTVHNANLVSEIRSRRRVWEERERRLDGAGDAPVIETSQAVPRPVALPSGPVERHADRAGTVSVAAFGTTLAATRNLRQATAIMLTALPKAALLGREAFAAQLARTLANRGIVAMDARVLRHLDRVDTVVVDAPLLSAGPLAITGVHMLDDGGQDAEAADVAERLFDPQTPLAVRNEGPWRLGPLRAINASASRAARGRARELAGNGAQVLALARGQRVLGFVQVMPALDPSARDLADAIRTAGMRFVVAGAQDTAGWRLDADEVVARGTRLPAEIRRMQANGALVAVISDRADALRAADCGIGVGSEPPLTADLVCGDDLDHATFIVEAAAVAAAVSRRSVNLSIGGSALGSLLALTNPRRGGPRQGLAAVNAATLAAMASGTWSALTLARRPRPVRADPTPWHELGPDAVLERLRSGADGLAVDEAHRRLAESANGDGREGLATRLARPFLAELEDPMTPVLALGAGVSAMIGSAADAALVGGLIGVNTVVGGLQRVRTDFAIDHLLRASVNEVRVRRDGRAWRVPADRLVPGDVLVLEAGEIVPADCRILAADGLEADESALTGESLPVGKSPEPAHNRPLSNRPSMLFEGTTVAAGTAEAVVVATVPQTESARALLATRAGPPPSGVEQRLAALTSRVAPVALGAGAGVIGAGLLRRWPTQEVIGSGVSLAVASVPEGLPFVTTAAQLAAARRLSKRNALVRNPRTIEALGRVDVLCFDKTGTLTEGELSLVSVSDGHTCEPLDALGDDRADVLAAALRATPPPGEAGTAGNSTDDAILAAADEADVKPTRGAPGWSPTGALPFEAARGFHAVLGATPDGSRLTVKGSPEAVLARCTAWRRADRPLDTDARETLDAAVERLAGSGLRVLGVAERTASEGSGLDEERVSRLTFLGLIALGDPVRPTAASAVNELRAAGVAVMMVTGDHPSTAQAVARALGIHIDGQSVLTGGELARLDDDALADLLPKVSVVARVTPDEKVRIVRGLQRAGRAVAMTGDGANDAPSIRLADVGVALGHRGTRTARQAADLVVTDDRVETIIDAIVEGRAMWGSVRDALSILVGGNLGEIGFTLGASVLSKRAPVNARQLLLVNLLTDLAPAMSIVLRPPDRRTPEELLREGPDRSLGDALSRDLVIRSTATSAGATAAWTLARVTPGTQGRTRTVALVSLVGTQLGQTLAAGGRSPLVLAAGLGSAAVLAGVVQTPGVSHFFGCRPLGPVAWTVGLGTAAVATAGAILADRIVPDDWAPKALTLPAGG